MSIIDSFYSFIKILVFTILIRFLNLIYFPSFERFNFIRIRPVTSQFFSKIFGYLSLVIFFFGIPQLGHAQPVINELLPDPDGTDADHEWVELFNPGPNAIDLTNYSLSDAKAHTFIFDQTSSPDFWIIQPGTFKTIFLTNTLLSLNNTGTETLNLASSSGQLLNSFSYTGSKLNLTHSRIPDGAESIVPHTPPSPDRSNSPPTPTPIYEFTPRPKSSASIKPTHTPAHSPVIPNPSATISISSPTAVPSIQPIQLIPNSLTSTTSSVLGMFSPVSPPSASSSHVLSSPISAPSRHPLYWFSSGIFLSSAAAIRFFKKIH